MIRNTAVEGVFKILKEKSAHIDPIHMIFELVDGVSEQFSIALHEMRLMHRKTAQFGGAHRSEIRRMGE